MTAAADPPRRPSAFAPWIRWGLSLVALGVTAAIVDVGTIASRLVDVDLRWVAVSLLLSVPLVASMAWRWHFIAGRLGADVRLGVAWREYYVSLLLNQVLPGGVAGDFARVLRQRDRNRHLGPVARSVIIERASGQLVLWTVLAVSAVAWGLLVPGPQVLLALGGFVAGGLGLRLALRHPRIARTRAAHGAQAWLGELQNALLARGAAAAQLGVSLVALALTIGMFYCSAAAVGASLGLGQAFLIVPWVLAATIIPVTAGGWGVREVTTVGMFQLAGMTAAEGVATSVVFGTVSLVSALPGFVVLLKGPTPFKPIKRQTAAKTTADAS